MSNHWDERYVGGDLPWDTGEPDAHLVELVEGGGLTSGRALEIGCGTGTNAIWLAARGFEVHAFDLSPVAIDMAKAKRDAAKAAVEFFEGRASPGEPVPSRPDFSVRDMFEDGPPPGPFDLVFDRGVLHVFDALEQRERFVQSIAQVLAPTGRWLSLLGSTEGSERDHGPPRRSARDIIEAVEPALELVSLRSTVFHANIPSEARAWLLLARHRATPAQPSTKR